MYDLEDLKMWEPILYGATSKKQLMVDVLKKKERMMMSKITHDVEVCFFCVYMFIFVYVVDI